MSQYANKSTAVSEITNTSLPIGVLIVSLTQYAKKRLKMQFLYYINSPLLMRIFYYISAAKNTNYSMHFYIILDHYCFWQFSIRKFYSYTILICGKSNVLWMIGLFLMLISKFGLIFGFPIWNYINDIILIALLKSKLTLVSL